VAEICAAKPSCCSNTWGAGCVNDVEIVCGLTTCGSTTTCAHNECSTGAALEDGCDACAADVCASANDPYCCEIEWDDICVSEVAEYCTTVCP
jgi:hypothetical protein